MDIFDRHKWKPTLYHDAEKLNAALKDLGVIGRKITSVSSIGLAQNMEPDTAYLDVRRFLADAGISYEAIDTGQFRNLPLTLMPCEVEICEPVMILFENGTTLELLPEKTSGLWVASNQISPEITDGTGRRNYAPDVLFHDIIGSELRDIDVIRITATSQGNSPYVEEWNRVTWQFWLSGDYGFTIRTRYSWNGWFLFGLVDQHHFQSPGNIPHRIPYSLIKKAQRPVSQIPIVEGHDGSSYFWINPVKLVEKTEKSRDGVEEYTKEEISIEEDDIFAFLYYFLGKYFDPSFPCEEIRDDINCMEGFQWNLEHNIYTYDTVSAMLADIERCCRMLLDDYDNPDLAELKSRFSIWHLLPDDSERRKYRTEAEKGKIIRDNIGVIIDFYKRFVRRMRSMMDHSPDYDLISFMGP